MLVLLFFGLFLATTTAHRITYIDVPQYGDPRVPAVLVCKYEFDKRDPPLHSVKWYRGKHEIFRYSPAEEPKYLTFKTLMSAETTGNCDLSTCTIHVKLPQNYNAKFDLRCEVSAEGPRFEIKNETRTLTVAVILKEDPEISEAPATVQLGEDVVANCTTQPAMPPANIVWYIDGQPEITDPWLVKNTQVSLENEGGLRSSWRSLRMKVATTKESIELRCEATQPISPPYVRTANVTLMVVKSPNLSKFTSSGTKLEMKMLLVIMVLVVHSFVSI